MKGLFFFESVEVPGGSPELGKGNPGWVTSYRLSQLIKKIKIYHLRCNKYIYIYIGL